MRVYRLDTLVLWECPGPLLAFVIPSSWQLVAPAGEAAVLRLLQKSRRRCRC